MQWKLLKSVKMPVSQVANSSDITKHNLCSHLIMMILFISVHCKWHYFPEATGFCRGSKECLQTNMCSFQMWQWFWNISHCLCTSFCSSSPLLPLSGASYHSPCRGVTHSVKGLSDMRHCNYIDIVSASAHALMFKANLTTERWKALAIQQKQKREGWCIV